MPTPAQFERDIHQRLLDGDPTAPADLIGVYLPRLEQRLRARWRWQRDDAVFYDAATDALFAYVRQPDRYDPAQNDLIGYLTFAAQRNMINWFDRMKRRGNLQMIPLEDVAQRGESRNTLMDDRDGDPANIVPGNMAAGEWITQLLMVFPDPVDRQLLFLIVEDERRTAVYSAVLEIGEQDINEQERTVKRHKDRIKKRLQRWGESFRE